MTAPVDVLAVMAEAIDHVPSDLPLLESQLSQAHGAVADLVEKCRAVTATGDYRTLGIAIDDLRAALARVGGAK